MKTTWITSTVSMAFISLVMVGCTKNDNATSTPASATPPANTAPAAKPAETKTSETVVPNTPTTPAPASAANTATAVAPNTTATNSKGEALYKASCRVCHDTGNLGSPRMGDKAAWKERIAQGNDTLYAHAITGFTGKTGIMPPKGASNASDSDIKAAVDYMVAKSQ